MMKRGLDERQDQLAAQIGVYSSYVMFFVSVAVIVAEVIWMGTFQAVIGETVILLAGGLTGLAGCIKNGIWAKSGGDMGAGQSLLLSVVCSGIFSVFYAAALYHKIGGDVDVVRHALLFFLGIGLLGFICLQILGRAAQRRRKEQENRYLE